MFTRWLDALIVDLLLIAAAFFAAATSVYLVVPAIFVIGTRIHAIAILAHDGAHFNAPEFMAKFAFNLIGVNLKKYREFHFEHHAKLGTYEDPELRVHTHHWDTFNLVCVIKDLTGLSTMEMLKIWRFAGGEPKRMAVVLVILALIDPLFAFLWMVSLGTVFMACFRQRAIIEHGYAYEIKPWMAVLFPHNCWRHAEHHANPKTPFYRLGKI